MGHVLSVDADGMDLEQGRVPLPAGTLCIDCTASAVEPRPVVPVFQGDRVVLQMVRLPLPTFSAALIAWVEAHGPDDATKNRLCGSVPFPWTLADYPGALLANMRNQYHWSQDKALRTWIRESRLDGFGKLIAATDPQDEAKQAILGRFRALVPAAMANLAKLAAGSPG
jgi:hypothetical protein